RTCLPKLWPGPRRAISFNPPRLREMVAAALPRKARQEPTADRMGCRHGSAQLSPPSLAARDHPPRDLALCPLPCELPRCRGTAGRTRARHLLRNRAALGAEVRPGDRATAAPAPPSAERSLAFWTRR